VRKKNYILNVEQMVWCVRVCHQKEIKKNKKKEASFHSVKEKKGSEEMERQTERRQGKK